MENKNISLSIYAKALSENRQFKNGKMNAVTLGSVVNYRAWNALVKACRIPAYTVRKYRYDNMSAIDTVAPCDMTALYDAIRAVLNLIGEVNGDKLNPANIAEEIVSLSVRFRVIDKTPEMAHARNLMRMAHKAMTENESDANVHAYEQRKAEVRRLEEIAGNCERIVEIQSESAFVKAVEIILGDAINKQCLRSVDEILAEKSAREAERKAKRKANKNAKKNANK